MIIEAQPVCQKCRRDVARVTHHILPISSGGLRIQSNEQRLCLRCHSLIHPWLNINGIKRECQILKKTPLGTFYGHTKARKHNVIVLENYSLEDIRGAIFEVKEKVQG